MSSSNDMFDSNAGSALCDNYLEQSYVQLRILCLEELKKPGKDYSRLLHLINDSQLTLRMRHFMVRELIYEASRFKRASLIQLLIKYAALISQIALAAESASDSPPVKEEVDEIETN